MWQANGDYTVEYKDDKPVFMFPSTDLIGTSNVDTITIKNESGKYYPMENLWIGTKGNITMQRTGFDPANNFVKREMIFRDLGRLPEEPISSGF